MSAMSTEKFKSWLKTELARRGWSQRELARRSDDLISYPYISLVLSDKRPVTWNFCAGVAAAFDMSPVDVFKIAGLLPQNGDAGLYEAFSELPREKQQNLIEYAHFLNQKKAS